MARKPLLVGQAELPVAGAGRQDDRAGVVGVAVTVHDLLLKAGLSNLPTAETFASLCMKEVSAQFTVERRDTGQTVGFVSFHHLDLSGQHVRASFRTDPALAGNDLAAEVILMTINYAFASWNIRKIYFWTTDTDLQSFPTAFSSTHREATLPEHLYDRGALQDVHIYATYREQWEEHGAALLDKLAQSPLERQGNASAASREAEKAEKES